MEEYRTKDLGEAAALSCSSTKLLRLEKEDNFFWFIFSNNDTCQKLSNNYWSGDLRVSAKEYSDALRSLKDRLFARK